MSDAALHEIFQSIQGEGLYVGVRQLFIRFSQCNLSCNYCDTPGALIPTKEYKVEQTPGTHDFKPFPNPVKSSELAALVLEKCRNKNAVHSLCLTGGEPLMQVDFLKDFLPKVKAEQFKVYLETNGTLPKHLEEVIDLIDIVSMDIKIPSATGGTFLAREHKEFLETAYTKEVFVKIVVVPESNIREIDEAVKIVAAIDEKIPLVIQPATPSRTIKHLPKITDLLAWQAFAMKSLKDVRVIPQVHKVLQAH